MMFPRRFRNPKDQVLYMQFRLWGTVFLVILLLGMAVHQSCREKGLSAQEKQMALDDYVNDPVRIGEIRERHKRCFEFSYQRKTRSEPEHFNRKRYRKCLDIGPDEWLRERREKRLREEREMREMMNP